MKISPTPLLSPSLVKEGEGGVKRGKFVPPLTKGDEGGFECNFV